VRTASRFLAKAFTQDALAEAGAWFGLDLTESPEVLQAVDETTPPPRAA